MNQDWRDDALCGDMVADGRMTLEESDKLFFDNGEPRPAIRLCENCPVSIECRDFAYDAEVPFGVFGAEPASDRRKNLGLTATGDPIHPLVA